MNRVLVPFDGSESSRRALGRLAFLATGMKPFEALLLNVQLPPAPKEFLLDARLSHVRELEGAMREAAMRLLEEAKKVLQAGGIACELHVEFGEPAPVIAEFAKRHHCDLVAMGTRGMSPIPSLLLGSVASKVLHAAEVPVLLTR